MWVANNSALIRVCSHGWIFPKEFRQKAAYFSQSISFSRRLIEVAQHERSSALNETSEMVLPITTESVLSIGAVVAPIKRGIVTCSWKIELFNVDRIPFHRHDEWCRLWNMPSNIWHSQYYSHMYINRSIALGHSERICRIRPISIIQPIVALFRINVAYPEMRNGLRRTSITTSIWE